MCRWLAYRGAPIRTGDLLLHPQHSLVAQSLNSPLGAETVNGDGFGVGWYPTDGSRPALFRSTEPAWNDFNLRELAEAVTSPLFISHVRAAAGPPIQQTNCHPFRHDNWLFAHNGYLHGFASYRREVMLRLDPDLFPLVQGTTDTEVFFHLALTHGLRDDPPRAMAQTVRELEEIARDAGVQLPVQMTVAISDGTSLWAFRYSTQRRSRSLFHSADIASLQEMYPDRHAIDEFGPTAYVVVSEPLNDLPGAFIEVPECTAVRIDDDGYHHEPFLAD
jgi:glutamine amidotransferase